VAWLGWITGPASTYVKTTLKSVIEGRVRAAEQRVVPCTLSVRTTGGAASSKWMTSSVTSGSPSR